MMDKSWIHIRDRTSKAYIDGVEQFLDFAYTNKAQDATIYCPCKKCCNRYYVKRGVAREHIIVDGFLPNYRSWVSHGERYVPINEDQHVDAREYADVRDDMVEMINEAIGIPNTSPGSPANEHNEGPNKATKEFLKLLQDAERELYPGCEKFTALSFMIRLLHIKVLCGWTNKSFTMLLELLNDAFPEGVKLPKSYYEANKITTDLGFTYKTWDACPNNCMLYRDNDEELNKCEICGASRYKQSNEFSDDINDGRKVAAK